jgi:hypothetical protein
VALCAGQPATPDLNGTWELAEIQSRPVQRNGTSPLPTFTIKEQTIEGFDGCNKFWGRLDKPGGIASTRMGCLDETIKLPLDLTDPKSHLEAGRIERERLVLPAHAGMPASVFQRVKSPRE